MIYENEDDQAEAIKKWWRENGKSLVAGVVIGLGGIFGWKAYQTQQLSSAASASVSFEQYKTAVENPDKAEAASGQLNLLEQEFGESAYAYLAKLMAAGKAVADGRPQQAQRALRWAAENAPDPLLAAIAKLRLARLMVSAGQLETAEALLGELDPGVLGADQDRLRGDIALARGDRKAAYAAYTKALEGGAGLSELLKMQLGELGDAGEG